MASPFSDLPSELHTSLRSSWLQETRPASILLGKPDGDGEPIADTSGIADLPQAVHQATTQEVAAYVRERDEAIDGFVETLRSQTFRSFPEGEDFEAVVTRLLGSHFEDKSLPLSPDTLQSLVDKCTGTMITQWFSPLFTVWSDKLKKQGHKQPVLELTWPEHLADRKVDFGEGMRDVELHITGKVNGEIGEDAVNCAFVFDTFEGKMGYRARGCTFQANIIDGTVLQDAKDSSVVCKDLKSPHITLGDGCTLEAETAKGTIREAIHFDEEGDIPVKPCTVTIGHLTGSIESGESWTVNIGEITEPPKPAPRAYTPSSYGGEIEYSPYSKEDPYDSQYIQLNNTKELGKSLLNISNYYENELIDDKESIYRKEKMSNLLGEIAIRNIIQNKEIKDD